MPRGIIHQTDLFRPYNDPDDHWDLATVFALAARGRLRLQGVLIDAPPQPRYNPDVEAVAQMNALHGMAVPAVVGSSRALRSSTQNLAQCEPTDCSGGAWLLHALKSSEEPVVISVVGSCRDVALAANTDPDLFRQRCAGVYLNAGYGAARLQANWELEYNVQRDLAAYRAMFDLPCPLYWLPCFEDTRRGEITEWGTLWWFRQSEILETLPGELQQYFLYALGPEHGAGWYQFLAGNPASELLSRLGSEVRAMWSTAGLLHAAGFVVDGAGGLAPLGKPGVDSVFEFVPVAVRCAETGHTSWEREAVSHNQFLFRVRHPHLYRQAMTGALRELLSRHGIGMPA